MSMECGERLGIGMVNELRHACTSPVLRNQLHWPRELIVEGSIAILHFIVIDFRG